MPTIYYVWLHQVDQTTRWVLNENHVSKLVLDSNTNLSWINIRYLIELKWFSRGRDFIVSVPERNDHEIIADGTKLILKRKPTTNTKLYVPQHILGPNSFAEHETEEAKIQRIIELAQVCRLAPQHVHPSRLTTETVPRIPPPHYGCAYCFEKGTHYIKNCPRKLKDLPARKLPAGLPKTFLRPAQTEEEKEMAFITNTGQYVVLKSMIDKHAHGVVK